MATAWVRVLAPSLPVALRTCTRTVAGEMPRRSATSSPVLPLASSSTTWCSRGERTPLPCLGRRVTVAVAVPGALGPAVAAQPRGEGGGVLLGVAQGGDVEQRRQHRAADGPRGHAHPAHAAVGALEAHDARALRTAGAQRVGAGPALGKRLARLRQALARRRQLGAAAQLLAIHPQQLAGGAVRVDHVGLGILDEHPLVDRVECGGGGEGRLGHVGPTTPTGRGVNQVRR